MNSYSLNIAGYTISFTSRYPDLVLQPSPRFYNYITTNQESEINVEVNIGECLLQKTSKMVFAAPFFEEVNGVAIKKREELWSVWTLPGYFFIKATPPTENGNKEIILMIPENSTNWELWFPGATEAIDPMLYPIDGLLLYYLTAIHNDIMIHASGIIYNHKGFIFSGVSGKGKSTMARLWENAGAEVIHDDRLIIKNENGNFWMHNTPVYDNDRPQKARISKLFLITHGKTNASSRIKGSKAVTSVLSNCIQHTWNANIVIATLNAITNLVSSVPIATLSFVPDAGIVDFILHGENNNNFYDVGLSVLASGKTIQVTANGYSMYPTIKPGSTIKIDPLTTEPVAGEIVAVKAENKFIVHRLINITKTGGQVYYQTRGDSNKSPDEPATSERIAGKVSGYAAKTQITTLRYFVNYITVKIITLYQRVIRRCFSGRAIC